MSGRQWVRQGNCRGITLVELLVSMTIGLFILGGVVKVMVDSKENFLAEEQLSYIQDNSRFAMNQIINDIRMAGYYGCSSKGQLTNSVKGSADASGWMFSANAIKGFEYSELTDDADFPNEIANSMRKDTDVVIVNRGEPEDSVQISAHNPALAEFKLNRASDFAAGQVLVVASPNCSNIAIFQMTGPSNSGKTEKIEHSAEGGTSPGNCYHELTSGYQCPGAPGKSVGGGEYPPGSSVMRFSSHGYYVGTSDITGQPSLYRQTLIVDSGKATTEAQELASGVEDLQILYGLDKDLDGTVDLYNTAKDIHLWDRVVAVRITLIMRSAHEMFAGDTLVDLGEGYQFEDRYMRQKVSSTIRIRNRSLGFTIENYMIKVSKDEEAE